MYIIIYIYIYVYFNSNHSQVVPGGDNCILLGTSRGRLVRLGMSSSSKLTPTTLGAGSGVSMHC